MLNAEWGGQGLSGENRDKAAEKHKKGDNAEDDDPDHPSSWRHRRIDERISLAELDGIALAFGNRRDGEEYDRGREQQPRCAGISA